MGGCREGVLGVIGVLGAAESGAKSYVELCIVESSRGALDVLQGKPSAYWEHFLMSSYLPSGRLISE